MRTLIASTLSLLLAGPLTAQEICNNGIDDDADGLIDLNDQECLFAGGWNDGVPSLLTNGSFEDRVVGPNGPCCPYTFATAFYRSMDCVEGWYQATSGSTDYMHACGYLPEQVVPLPLPDGEGCVGTIAFEGYDEYLGRSFAPALPADIAYTFTGWMASSSTSTVGHDGVMLSGGVPYQGPWTIGLFGRPDVVAMPLSTSACLDQQSGWVRLGSVQVPASRAWQPISIPFTASFPLGTLIIGATCDLPADIAPFEGPGVLDGDTVVPAMDFFPYVLFDGFALAPSEDLIEGIVRSGAWCTNDLVLTAHTDAGSSDGQWYRDGIALVGATASALDLSAGDLDGGLYTYTCRSNGDGIRSDMRVAVRPAFTTTALSGGPPLEVTLSVTTPQYGDAQWDLGDGTVLSGDAVTHVFEEPGTYTITLQQQVDGCATTATMTIVVESGTGITGAAGRNALAVFPNPVNDHVRVPLPDAIDAWRVLNALGQPVLQGGRTSGTLAFGTEGLGKGAYTLLVESGGQRMIARFIKR